MSRLFFNSIELYLTILLLKPSTAEMWIIPNITSFSFWSAFMAILSHKISSWILAEYSEESKQTLI